MKNKNWLIRSKTAKGVKNVTACQSLKGQDQYALFRNGELVRGVGNLEDTIDKFLRFEECDYCEENNDEGDDGDGGWENISYSLSGNKTPQECNKNIERNLKIGLVNSSMGNFSAGTIFNIEWSGLDVGYSITVSNGHSLSELIGINSQLTLTSDWIPNAVIIIYIVKEDIGCVAPFGEITITVTTEDYILSNINNELIL